MTEIIAENFQETSPLSLAERLAAMRADLDQKWAPAGEDPFTTSDRARMENWSLDKRLRVAIQNLTKIQSRLRHRPVRRATTPRLRRVVRAVRRDRRSPAAVRATADSGGSSGDPDPDPEPPRPLLYSLPASGGAL